MAMKAITTDDVPSSWIDGLGGESICGTVRIPPRFCATAGPAAIKTSAIPHAAARSQKDEFGCISVSLGQISRFPADRFREPDPRPRLRLFSGQINLTTAD